MPAAHSIEIREDVPLAPFTTLGIGGPARFFVSASTRDEVSVALRHAKAAGLDLFILGGGSNILVSDSGFDGLVLQPSIRGTKIIEETDDEVFVQAGAGDDWDEFVSFCVNSGFAGVECLSGIPGFVGGTPIQNVGAYGQEVAETIVSVEVIDRVDGERKTFSNADCRFEYRRSVFNTTERERYIVLSVVFELRKNGTPTIVYRDLVDRLSGEGLNLQRTRKAVLEIRADKAMVIDERDVNTKSAGSFFKNPVVPVDRFTKIAALAVDLGVLEKLDDMPGYLVDTDTRKIPAAWLIEKSGFEKGFVLGKAGLSRRHTLAIINRGGATAGDIVALKDLIQTTVHEKFGVQLTPEPVFVGFE